MNNPRGAIPNIYFSIFSSKKRGGTPLSFCLSVYLQIHLTKYVHPSGPATIAVHQRTDWRNRRKNKKTMGSRRTLHLAASHIVFVKHIPKIYSSSFKSLLTIPGLALPCIAFIVWPTRNPIAFSLPAL